MNIKRPPPREAWSKERTPSEGQTRQNKPWQALQTAGSGTTADPRNLTVEDFTMLSLKVSCFKSRNFFSAAKKPLHPKKPLGATRKSCL